MTSILQTDNRDKTHENMQRASVTLYVQIGNPYVLPVVYYSNTLELNQLYCKMAPRAGLEPAMSRS